MGTEPNSIFGIHIFLLDCYESPKYKNSKKLLDYFKFELRLEIRKRIMIQRIRAEQAKRASSLPRPMED